MIQFVPMVLLGLHSGDLAEAIGHCRTITADIQRLACYDKLAGEQPAAVPEESRATPEADVARAHADFGLTEEQRSQKRKEPIAPVQLIESSVSAMDKLPNDRFVLQLANGQKWVQIEPTPIVRFRVGDAITIRKAALESYLAIGPHAPMGVRVRRVD